MKPWIRRGILFCSIWVFGVGTLAAGTLQERPAWVVLDPQGNTPLMQVVDVAPEESDSEYSYEYSDDEAALTPQEQITQCFSELKEHPEEERFAYLSVRNNDGYSFLMLLGSVKDEEFCAGVLKQLGETITLRHTFQLMLQEDSGNSGAAHHNALQYATQVLWQEGGGAHSVLQTDTRFHGERDLRQRGSGGGAIKD